MAVPDVYIVRIGNLRIEGQQFCERNVVVSCHLEQSIASPNVIGSGAGSH